MNKKSRFYLFFCFLAGTLLFGNETSMELKEIVLSALAFPQKGSYSAELFVEQTPKQPSYKVKLLQVVSDQYGVMTRCEFPYGTHIVRDGKCYEIQGGKVYVISLQDPKYNPQNSFWMVYNVFQILLENIPCEYHQASYKAEYNQPGLKITVDFPKEYTSEQLDIIHRFFPGVTSETFWSKLVFYIGKTNGFLYNYEIFYRDGRQGYGMSFSKVKVNPEWTLNDFTPPKELATVEISTEKQFKEHFSTKGKTPVYKRLYQTIAGFLKFHQARIEVVLTRFFSVVGILLLLTVIVIYFRRKHID